MTRELAFARRFVLGILLAATPAIARADTPRDAPSELEIDRNEAPGGRTELGFDGGAPVDGWGATISGGWLERPVTFGTANGDSFPVRRRQTATLGAAIALGTSVVIDARFGLSHQVGDRLRVLDDPRPLDRFVPGDLRIGGRVRVAGTAARAVFIRADLTLPTGDELDFAGEPSSSIAWRLIGRATLPAGIVAAVTVGLRLRGEEVFVGDRLIGNEFLGGFGIAVPIPPIRPLWCVADQVKLTAEVVGAIGDNVGSGRGPSPIEARLGLVTQPLPSFTLGVRAGVGLSNELGAPDFRAMVEVTYRGSFQLIPRAPESTIDAPESALDPEQPEQP